MHRKYNRQVIGTNIQTAQRKTTTQIDSLIRGANFSTRLFGVSKNIYNDKSHSAWNVCFRAASTSGVAVLRVPRRSLAARARPRRRGASSSA
jgi:hypothetical protein